jgi:Eukaryotic aspartyl protease
MWVNPNCSAGADKAVCDANGHYDPKISKHSTPLGSYFDFRYGTGFARGQYYGDWMYFRENNLLIAQQFGLANQSQYAVAGILGLGYGSPANLDYPSTLDSLVQYQRIAAPIFSVDFGGQGDGFSMLPSPWQVRRGSRTQVKSSLAA